MTEVLCTGTFNLLHSGHVQLLEFASKFGKLTVGVNSDSYLKKKYNNTQVIPLVHRVYMLKSLRFVDDVVVFLEDDPRNLIYQLRPAYFVRGPDYAGADLIEQEALDSVGAQLIIHHADKIYNASELVKKAPKGIFTFDSSSSFLESY